MLNFGISRNDNNNKTNILHFDTNQIAIFNLSII